MNKNTKVPVISGAIILILYIAVFFIVPFPKNACAWTEFAFSIVSVFIGSASVIYSVNKGSDLRSKVYGFPVARTGYFYALTQIIFSLIICSLGFAVDVPVWIALLISVLILGAALIGMIGADTAADIISAQDNAVEAVTRPVRTFRLNMQHIADTCSDKQLKSKLERLSDEFRYSDPVSNDELYDIEEKLRNEVEQLEKIVNTDTVQASELADRISIDLYDRNRLCKDSKHR